MKSPFTFPEEINETSARLVAAGVVTMCAVTIATDQPWILVAVVYGFLARVLFGPRFSPLARLSTQLLTPRIHVEHRFSPGPPKRLAQAMGFAMSAAALIVGVGFGNHLACDIILGALMGAASLEAGLGFCAGCKIFYALMKLGVIPEETCVACSNIWARHGAAI
jgi:hypothetical protein